MATTSGSAADFDFLMGIWRCHHRYRVRRLADCNDWIEFDGTAPRARSWAASATPTRATSPCRATRYTGMSLRTWDPDTSRWSIHWLDSRRPGYSFRRSTAASRNGRRSVRHLLRRRRASRAAPIRVRLIWSRIAEQSARWEQAFSLDEGNNWETNWYMDFTRV